MYVCMYVCNRREGGGGVGKEMLRIAHSESQKSSMSLLFRK